VVLPRAGADAAEVGLALPLFLKWDDVELALRAGAAGFPTVALPGASVWHEPWTGKADTLDWQAYYHQRNRVVAALLHSPSRRALRLLAESLEHTLVPLVSMRYAVVALRLRALEDVLAGPHDLHPSLGARLGEVRALRASCVDGRPVPRDALPPAGVLPPVVRPRGRRRALARLALEVGRTTVRSALPDRRPSASPPTRPGCGSCPGSTAPGSTPSPAPPPSTGVTRAPPPSCSGGRCACTPGAGPLAGPAHRYRAALPDSCAPATWERTLGGAQSADGGAGGGTLAPVRREEPAVHALGAVVVRRRWAVLVAWVVLVALGFTVGSGVFARMTAVGRLVVGRVGPRLGAARRRRDDRSPGGRRRRRRRPDRRGRAGRGHGGHRRPGALDGVAQAADPYGPAGPALVARDGRALLVGADLERDLDDEQSEQALDAVVERLRAIDVGTVTVGGDLLLNREINAAVEHDLQRGELISLPVALVVMVVVFGGVLAAGLPLVAALSTIAGALLVLLGASYALDLSPGRRQRRDGPGPRAGDRLRPAHRQPLPRGAGRRAGRGRRRRADRARPPAGTVAFSGVTVAVSLCGLLVLDDPTFRSMGAAGIAVVLVAVAAALTLTPALLALLGGRLRVRAVRSGTTAASPGWPGGCSGGRCVVALATAPCSPRRPRRSSACASSTGGAELIPRSFETRQVADALSTRFEGREADPSAS
jgi:hypothetical protein